MAFVRARTQKADVTKGNPCVKFSLTFVGDSAIENLLPIASKQVVLQGYAQHHENWIRVCIDRRTKP
jgi:hypothetical protein